MTFVASSRPPSPASIAATFTPLAAKSANAAAVRISNCVAPSSSAAGRTRSIAALEAVRIASAGARANPRRAARCTRGRRSSRASRRVAVDFPFVPTTWIVSSSRCGIARAGEQLAHPLEPEAVRRPRAEATQPSASSSATVLRELLALALDGRRIGVRDELLVREHLLRPVDLLLQARALGLDVALRRRSRRPNDRLEDPQRVAVERDPHLAAPVDARRRLRPVERAEVAVHRCGSGHGATISRVSRPGSCVQISSVTCGMTGWRSLSSRSSAASAVARTSSSPRRGLIDSRYQSQKSSNVRW